MRPPKDWRRIEEASQKMDAMRRPIPGWDSTAEIRRWRDSRRGPALKAPNAQRRAGARDGVGVFGRGPEGDERGSSTEGRHRAPRGSAG